jgi:hypothetical protein
MEVFAPKRPRRASPGRPAAKGPARPAAEIPTGPVGDAAMAAARAVAPPSWPPPRSRTRRAEALPSSPWRLIPAVPRSIPSALPRARLRHDQNRMASVGAAGRPQVARFGFRPGTGGGGFGAAGGRQFGPGAGNVLEGPLAVRASPRRSARDPNLPNPFRLQPPTPRRDCGPFSPPRPAVPSSRPVQPPPPAAASRRPLQTSRQDAPLRAVIPVWPPLARLGFGSDPGLAPGLAKAGQRVYNRLPRLERVNCYLSRTIRLIVMCKKLVK